MTQTAEEDGTKEQTVTKPTPTEEPISTEPPAAEAPPTENGPISTEDNTEATPPAAEATPTETQSDEPLTREKPADDFFDMDPGKENANAPEAPEMATESSAPEGAESAPFIQSKGVDEGEDETDAVPVAEGEEDVPVQESGFNASTTTAEQPSEDTAAATASESTPTVNGTEEETAQTTDTPAEEPPKDIDVIDSPPEQKEATAESSEVQEPEPPAESPEKPCEVQVTVTEAGEVAADGNQDKESGVASEDGGEAPQGVDEPDTPAPGAFPVADKSQELAPVMGADTRPSTAAFDYEDDFHSIASAEVAAQATERERTTTPVDAPPAQEIKCPSPSVAEEARAEVGFVVPVPASAPIFDGRSQAEERGEYRGEDRVGEVQPNDGGENARGQGQWKTDEENFVESTLAEQSVEKAALQKVTEEKERVEKELDELKGRYVALEQSSLIWEMEAGVLQEKCQKLESRLAELEAEIVGLREQAEANKINESKVKDLQERLGILSEEDAKKEQRLQKLQEDLQETESRLTAAEHQATISREAAERLQQQPTQSKTCVIM